MAQQYPQPQHAHAPMQPPTKKHTVRNVFIVLGILASSG